MEHRLRRSFQAEAGLTLHSLATKQRARRLRHLLQATQVRTNQVGIEGASNMGSAE